MQKARTTQSAIKISGAPLCFLFHCFVQLSVRWASVANRQALHYHLRTGDDLLAGSYMEDRAEFCRAGGAGLKALMSPLSPRDKYGDLRR